MQALDVLLVQNSAGTDEAANRAAIEGLLDGTSGTDLIALPEVCLLRGGHEDYVAQAASIPGPTTEWLAGLARRHGAWLLAGSTMEAADGVVYNTSLLFDRAGGLRAAYRKMHLFEATLDTGEVIRESDTYAPGAEPVQADIEGWSCGLSICYDLRFPELYRRYAVCGAALLLIPSNFTQRTGRDHWNVLVRARAIENQCFVVAPGQCGRNPRTGVESHGHSMVAEPWGGGLADAGRDEGVIRARLDPARLNEVRSRIPVLDHRRLVADAAG